MWSVNWQHHRPCHIHLHWSLHIPQPPPFIISQPLNQYIPPKTETAGIFMFKADHYIHNSLLFDHIQPRVQLSEIHHTWNGNPQLVENAILTILTDHHRRLQPGCLRKDRVLVHQWHEDDFSHTTAREDRGGDIRVQRQLYITLQAPANNYVYHVTER